MWLSRRTISIACVISSQVLFVPSLIILGLVLEGSLQERFWSNWGSGKYSVDLSCMNNSVFQPEEITFRFWQVKVFPVTLSRCINYLEKCSADIVACSPLILGEDQKIQTRIIWRVEPEQKHNFFGRGLWTPMMSWLLG